MDENINKINIKTKRGPDNWFWKGTAGVGVVRIYLGSAASMAPMVFANIAFPLGRSADRDKMSNGVCGVAESLRGFGGPRFFSVLIGQFIYYLSGRVSESVPRIWNWKGR